MGIEDRIDDNASRIGDAEDRLARLERLVVRALEHAESYSASSKPRSKYVTVECGHCGSKATRLKDGSCISRARLDYDEHYAGCWVRELTEVRVAVRR